MKVVRLTIRNRAVALLAAILILALGATFLTVGIALLAGLVLAGTVVGAGAIIYRRLVGRPNPHSGQRLSGSGRLDPRLEVQPSQPPTIAAPKDADT